MARSRPRRCSTTPPASARWRLVCRRESIARLAKSGSFVALRPACAPWLRVLVPRRPPPRPSLRSPSATGRSQPLFEKLRAPASGTGFVPQPVPAAPTPRLLRSVLSVVPPSFTASAIVSRSFVAVAAAPLPSRHPPRKNFGRRGPASQQHQPRPNF